MPQHSSPAGFTRKAPVCTGKISHRAAALGYMKSIDIKSAIIGVLLTSTIFLGVAATSKDDAGKWDDKQSWVVGSRTYPQAANVDPMIGREPFAIGKNSQGEIEVYYRKRNK